MKNYNHKIFYFLAVVIIFFVGICLINYFGDGGNQFFRAKKFETELANTLQKKEKVLVCGNYNDRNVKKLLLQQLQLPVDILILGSSRSMPISIDHFKIQNFFNASVTSATLEDDIALYFIYQQHGWKPKTVVINLDPWLINGSGKEFLWPLSFFKEYKHATKVIGETKTASYLHTMSLLEKSKQLISIQYFIESIKSLYSTQLITDPTVVKSRALASCHLHLPDGTRLISEDDEQTSGKKADYAGTMWSIGLGSQKSKESYRKKFEKFITYLIAQNINIIFILPPYEPESYKEIETNFKDIVQIENYFKTFAAKNNIKVIGSYNPHVLELVANDFIDDIHLKKQGIDKLLMHV